MNIIADASDTKQKLDGADMPACFQNSSLNESKAKNLCRKHPTQVIKYPFVKIALCIGITRTAFFHKLAL